MTEPQALYTPTRPLPIPDAALAQHVAILGKTGSGKTTTGKLVVEHLVGAGARVCILDPIKSDWWGLTSSRDGRSAGLPFHILGGPRGHVPLHATAGAAVAEVVANGALPLSIIDMADFAPGGHAQFFNAFAPALLKRMRGVVTLVIEEAHIFAPKERSGIGAENMAIHYAKQLATAGRSKGIRLLVLTQRVQALHNAVLGSCDTLVAHRFTAPADQGPILAWLKANVVPEIAERVKASLSSLPTGTGWLCAGEAQVFERVAFPPIATYDNTKTPTDGDDRPEVATAPVDTATLRQIIGDAVAEAEANDPKRLRATVETLRREIAELRNSDGAIPAGAEAKIDQLTSLVNDLRGDLVGTREDLQDSERELEHVLAGRATLLDLLAQIRFLTTLDPAQFQPLPKTPRPERATGDDEAPALIASRPDVKAAQDSVTRATRALLADADDRGAAAYQRGADRARADSDRLRATAVAPKLTPAKQRILDALEWWRTIGRETVSRRMVAFVAGVSSKSSSYENNVSALRTAGLVDYPGPDALRLTNAGAALAEPPGTPTTTESLQRMVLDQLSPAQRRILGALLKAHPKARAREAIATEVGASPLSSSFENNVSALSGLGLVTYPERGKVRAADDLFLEVRR